jgi:hypothetical protein
MNTNRERYHADALRDMTDEQREAITYLAGGDPDNFSLDGVLPDGDLYIYTDHGHAYYRVTRDGKAYENREERVSTPAHL